MSLLSASLCLRPRWVHQHPPPALRTRRTAAPPPKPCSLSLKACPPRRRRWTEIRLPPPDLPGAPSSLDPPNLWTVSAHRPKLLSACLPLLETSDLPQPPLWSNCLVFLSGTCTHLLICVEAESWGDGRRRVVSCRSYMFVSPFWLTMGEIPPSLWLFFVSFQCPTALLISLTDAKHAPSLLFLYKINTFTCCLFACGKLHKYIYIHI